MDATIVRAHQHASGAQTTDYEAIGRSKGGRTTKIHALCDAHGNPTKIVLTPGQTHDVTRGKVLIGATEIGCESLLGDKAYDAVSIRDKALSLAITPVIPFRTTTQVGRDAGFDGELYRHRHLVENLFCRLKQFRGIATRYDKLARNFLAHLQMVCALLWACV
jgi:transposase